MSKPIPVSQATAMIKTYDAYMQTLGVDMKEQTLSVGFQLPELMAWLSKISEVADEIRVCMGDYPDGHPQAGRTTVVLWPYKNGEPAKKARAGNEPAPEPGNGEGEGNGDEGANDNGDCHEDEDEDGDPCGYPGGDLEDPYNEGTLRP